jgi:murein DD-endopeptidase MepM/ murein hydrolase activator NlpD
MRKSRFRQAAAWAGVLLSAIVAAAADQPTPLDRYVVDYPVAQQFCTPVETYFDDVSQTIQQVGGRTIRHQLNGGYGLPIIEKVGDQHLLHLGADVAWHQAGAPVYAIADGVVRVSQGPPPAGKPKKSQKKISNSNPTAQKSTHNIPDTLSDAGDLPLPSDDQPTNPPGQPKATRRPSPMAWGNLMVIEHHLPDGSYVTAIYGHLATKRLVSVGDVVQAGQVIGAVGRPGIENGGFKPHLHFGLHDGRMFEPGCTLFTIHLNGKPVSITLVDLKDKEVELKSDGDLPTPLHLTFSDEKFSITPRDGKLYLPAAALNYIPRPDFPITGYALSTKGWLDPTEFLRKALDHFPRANFGGTPKPQTANAIKRR